MDDKKKAVYAPYTAKQLVSLEKLREIRSQYSQAKKAAKVSGKPMTKTQAATFENQITRFTNETKRAKVGYEVVKSDGGQIRSLNTAKDDILSLPVETALLAIPMQAKG